MDHRRRHPPNNIHKSDTFIFLRAILHSNTHVHNPDTTPLSYVPSEALAPGWSLKNQADLIFSFSINRILLQHLMGGIVVDKAARRE
mmetsp:Transcript_4138/g.5660  ORF Transcript_4138/g.5660 Transcript_4138/m.5660 type:complete len:87 (+) Transcript_4138:185-445(+)